MKRIISAIILMFISTSFVFCCQNFVFAGPVPPLRMILPSDAPPPEPNIKRVKFICGSFGNMLSGEHYTVINVLNPHAETPRVTWTKEFILDVPEPEAGGTATSATSGPIAFNLTGLTSMRIDCEDIAKHFEGVQGADKLIGYVIIQAPWFLIQTTTCCDGCTDTCSEYEGYSPIVSTVYETTGGGFSHNLIFFELDKKVGNLPANKPLEIIVSFKSQGTRVIDIEMALRSILDIPRNVNILVKDVDSVPYSTTTSLDVETPLEEKHY